MPAQSPSSSLAGKAVFSRLLPEGGISGIHQVTEELISGKRFRHAPEISLFPDAPPIGTQGRQCPRCQPHAQLPNESEAPQERFRHVFCAKLSHYLSPGVRLYVERGALACFEFGSEEMSEIATISRCKQMKSRQADPPSTSSTGSGSSTHTPQRLPSRAASRRILRTSGIHLSHT